MKPEIERYFFKKYKTAKFRVVSSHWPEFKSIAEVDKWLEEGNSMVAFIVGQRLSIDVTLSCPYC